MKTLSVHAKEIAFGNRSVSTILAQSRTVRRYCDLFYRATGLQVMLLPTDGSDNFHILAGPRRSICKLMIRNRAGRAICQQFAQTLPTDHDRVCQKHCFAGLTTLAVPIIIDQQPVARLMCGQVFCNPPTDQDFDRFWNRLGRLGLSLKRQRITQAFFQTRVATTDQIEAAVELLEQMVQRLTATLHQRLEQFRVTEPSCIQQAKQLVETRLTEKLTTRQVARATQVSLQYFCRAFKAATGMTFTAYVASRRIDRAKQLLANPSTRILDVSLAVGFGSLSRFAQAFKRDTGVTAMAYRQAIGLGENRYRNKRKNA